MVLLPNELRLCTDDDDDDDDVNSGSMDGTVKIWDVYNERHVKRTYNGHSQAVRCINFNNDGSK